MGSRGAHVSGSLEEVLDVFRRSYRPGTPLTSSEVAEELGCSRRTAYRKLETLTERGLLNSKKTGARSRIWWRTGAEVTRGELSDEGDSGVRESLERKLRREREQTDVLVETAPVAIAIEDVEGETVLANRRARSAFGPIGQVGDEGDGPGEDRTVYDDAGTRIEQEALPPAQVRRTGEPVWEEELVIEDQSGERSWFSVNAAPIGDADGSLERIVTTGANVTERKALERQLDRWNTDFETELNEILGRMTDVFTALDTDWRITYLNERARKAIVAPLDEEYTREELIGRHLWSVNPDATAADLKQSQLYRSCLEAMERQEMIAYERYLPDEELWVYTRVYPSETGVSIFSRDITKLKATQQRLESSNERLEQFASVASHDLREPLRMVTHYLQLVESRYADALDEDGREFVRYAVDGADRMREMVDGLLEYSRVETSVNPFEPIDLDALFEEVRSDLEVRIDEQDAVITAESLPTVEGDASQLRQAFQNLVQNAIEYSVDEPPRVHVAAERTGSRWTVSVRDDGIGIDPDDQERIFTIFERLHDEEEHSGTGIGLALVKRIVERHGGEIRVDSTPGEGTTFSFTLSAVDDEN